MTIDRVHSILESLIKNSKARMAYYALQREGFLHGNYVLSVPFAVEVIEKELGVGHVTAGRYLKLLGKMHHVVKTIGVGLLHVKSLQDLLAENDGHNVTN